MYVWSHLRTMFVNWDSVKGFFPDFFLQEDHLSVIPDDPVNKDDVNIESQVSGKFNIETGLWDYPALLKQAQRNDGPAISNSTLYAMKSFHQRS